MPNHFTLIVFSCFFGVKGAIYYVAFGNGDIFTCEDIMFSRESSPGISSVFIHEPLWVVTHTAWVFI